MSQHLQAAAKKADKLSPGEMKRMRQAKDPHFKKSSATKQESDAFMPPPASHAPPKRKKGLGFQVTLLQLCFLHLRPFHISRTCDMQAAVSRVPLNQHVTSIPSACIVSSAD